MYAENFNRVMYVPYLCRPIINTRFSFDLLVTVCTVPP